MEVIEILGEKGNAVETASPDASVGDIVVRLTGKKIGVVVIVDDAGKPVGIVSERDIVSGLAADGPEIVTKKVADIMTKNVETCVPSEDVTELMVKMVFGRMRHLPVIDGGEMVGIVSIGDVVKGGLQELRTKSDIIQGYLMQPMAAQDGDD